MQVIKAQEKRIDIDMNEVIPGSKAGTNSQRTNIFNSISNQLLYADKM